MSSSSVDAIKKVSSFGRCASSPVSVEVSRVRRAKTDSPLRGLEPEGKHIVSRLDSSEASWEMEDAPNLSTENYENVTIESANTVEEAC